MAKFFIYNEGTCVRLKLFGEDIKKLFILNGWQESIKSKADYILINTCSFLAVKEKYFLRFIRKKTDCLLAGQQLVVFGCLPATNPLKILKINQNIILFKRNLDEIADFFQFKNKKIKLSSIVSNHLSLRNRLINYLNYFVIHNEAINYRLRKNKVFHLKISEGCLGRCAYCTEKFTTVYQSRKIKEIIKEFEEGLRMGFKYFALNSDDTSAFGADNNEKIADLLSKILGHKEDYKIAVTEFNPRGLMECKVLDLFVSPKIIFVTIPIQSGSQRILNLMRRPYLLKQIIPRIKALKRMNPALMINTHIIVGFPTEKKEDFKKTLALFDENVFDRVKIFEYSDRPGTESSQMKGKISNRIIRKRTNKLRKKILYSAVKRRSLANFLVNLKTLD